MPVEKSTGILIGRFQVLELNNVHKKLIKSLQNKHQRTLVFLASNPAPSDRNPLDWIFRAQMFEEAYGNEIQVNEMPDLPDDRIWSQELDRRILELQTEGTVTLYGTQAEFIDRYSGKFETQLLEAQDDDFPKEMPMEEIHNLRDFRAGILYASLRRFPTAFPTVDIAVFRDNHREILLARKENETKMRFPGGFADPTDDSYEMSALRELFEECGEIDIEDLMYIGSKRISDWRYHRSVDALITHLYVCTFLGGDPSPNDDIAELRWIEVSKLHAEMFIPEHRELVELLMEYLEEV